MMPANKQQNHARHLYGGIHYRFDQTAGARLRLQEVAGWNSVRRPSAS
jgi:hypothetical protein